MEGLTAESHLKGLGSLGSRSHMVVGRLSYNNPFCTRVFLSKSLCPIRTGFLTSQKQKSKSLISSALKLKTSLVHSEDLSFCVAGAATMKDGRDILTLVLPALNDALLLTRSEVRGNIRRNSVKMAAENNPRFSPTEQQILRTAHTISSLPCHRLHIKTLQTALGRE